MRKRIFFSKGTGKKKFRVMKVAQLLREQYTDVIGAVTSLGIIVFGTRPFKPCTFLKFVSSKFLSTT